MIRVKTTVAPVTVPNVPVVMIVVNWYNSVLFNLGVTEQVLDTCNNSWQRDYVRQSRSMLSDLNRRRVVDTGVGPHPDARYLHFGCIVWELNDHHIDRSTEKYVVVRQTTWDNGTVVTGYVHCRMPMK